MAAVFNGYTPPTPACLPSGEALYGPDPYDYNFCFPVDFTQLETDRVALAPLVPRIHAQLYFEEVSKNTEIEKWLHIRHDTLEQFLQSLEVWRRDPNQLVLAIIDKGRSGPAPSVPGCSFAGIIGLINTSAGNLSTEMGPVIVLPHAQRTYVTLNAVGLLLRYCLEVPSKGGLGLRRVQWSSHPANVRSVQVAVRMGFKREGMLRWTLALPDEKKVGNGRALREGDPRSSRPRRDTEVLGFCFEEWEAGGHELVQARMERR
ncbi:acyl-CoA N-acyltransferase [Peniophora sp. CONT]|nr:acyl-CoA N-acyltransferase [Peniophora sp. CONT]